MSTDTEHLEEGTTLSVLESWEEWYHVPVLAVVMLFMIWVRTLAYDRFVTDDGTPALAAVDSWYHWRTVEWTTENYPNTMPYEVWTGFPEGHYTGQFGTLFDQLIVTAAMIVGLGDPSTETLYTVALLAVPVMAALVAIPVFYMGRRLGGTIGGIVSIVILALAPGTFLTRSTTGSLDHHVAEALFMAVAVLAMMVALRVAEREKPIYELVVDRDWDALRTPAIYSVLAGIALSLYVWVWPAGVVLIGIFGVFFAVQLCLDYVRGISPDHVAFVGAISMAVATIFTGALIEVWAMGVTNFGYLQPLLAVLVAVGCLFMAWFARQWNGLGVDRRYYPAAIGGIGVAGLLVLALALPDLYNTLIGNLTGRLIPLNPSTTSLTVSEVQPPDDFTSHVFGEFGTAFYTMLVGLGLLAVRPFVEREYRAEHTLVIVWSLFLISMAATQARFGYYLILAVAVVNAVFVADVVRVFDLDLRGSFDSIREIEGYQVIVLVLAITLLFAPLLPPVAAGSTAWERADQAQPHGEAMLWEGSNHWLADNTPEPGDWAGAGNDDELDYFGTYEHPEDGDFDYPEGAYGVISWWDYGHLITTQAERIPHSNPFQQNARSSSAFLTAESEERSELILDAIAAGESPSDHFDEELEQMAEGAAESHEHIRYVMIDDRMAGGKFPAIATWTGPDPQYYTTPEDLGAGERLTRDNVADRYASVPYDRTTLSRLYFDDAVGMEHYRLVHENDARVSGFVSYAQVYDEEALPPQQAEELAAIGYQDGDVLYYGDEGLTPPGQGQPAVTINRQVGQQDLVRLDQDPMVEVFDVREGLGVKTYERVEGATITGDVGEVDDPANATVSAVVELETNTDREFAYAQEADLAEDGTFELTVAYPTDDELGVEDGYTDSAVEALDAYTVSVTVPTEDGFDAYEGEVDVPESAVVDGESVTVDLEAIEFEDVDDPEDAANETDTDDDLDVDEIDADDGNTTEDEGEGIDDGAEAEAAGSIAPVAVDP